MNKDGFERFQNSDGARRVGVINPWAHAALRCFFERTAYIFVIIVTDEFLLDIRKHVLFMSPVFGSGVINPWIAWCPRNFCNIVTLCDEEQLRNIRKHAMFMSSLFGSGALNL
jgi:hypothetical protein